MTDQSISKTDPLRPFVAKSRNVHSQFGEDGIIEFILSHFPERDFWCVEFGAWDGTYLSNTRRLIDEENYHAVFIEADLIKFKELQQTFAKNDRVFCVNGFVGFEKSDGLDTILSSTPCPKQFDFLSIDIDGNDFHVWNAIEIYRPKLVCIEFNPTMPIEANYTQPKDPKKNWGSSLSAIFELGLKKGYRLVHANTVNAFFVANEFWTGEYATDVSELKRFCTEPIDPAFVFIAYDGTVILSRPVYSKWHWIRLQQSDVQFLPKALRRYPDDYNAIQRLMWFVIRMTRKLKGKN